MPCNDDGDAAKHDGQLQAAAAMMPSGNETEVAAPYLQQQLRIAQAAVLLTCQRQV